MIGVKGHFCRFSVGVATDTFFLTMLMVQIIIMQNLRFFRAIADFIKILEVSDFSIAAKTAICNANLWENGF